MNKAKEKKKRARAMKQITKISKIQSGIALTPISAIKLSKWFFVYTRCTQKLNGAMITATKLKLDTKQNVKKQAHT